jgi:hypothetical protein
MGARFFEALTKEEQTGWFLPHGREKPACLDLKISQTSRE